MAYPKDRIFIVGSTDGDPTSTVYNARVNASGELSVVNAASTDGSQETKIVDPSGNEIGAELGTDGDYQLHTNITQNVYADPNNSSTTNLAASATFAGLPTSTLGVVGLQWSINTDQNCTVYVEQSNGSHTGIGTVATNGSTTLTGTNTVFTRSFVVGDTISVAGETDRIVATIVSSLELTVTVAFSTTASGTAYTHYHWDISYGFDYKYKVGAKGEGETVQATQSYWRIRVVNEGLSTTTYFRVAGVLCPFATPLPSSLSEDARLNTETTITGRHNADRHAWVNPTNEIAISPVYRLVGTAFVGTTLDSNFWTATLANTGTVAQTNGVLTLLTSTASASAAKYATSQQARFVAGSGMWMSGGVNWVTAGTTSNTRRVGAYTATDGYFMQLAGTVFSVGTRVGSSDTLVNSGSFNGVLGLTWAPTANAYNFITIEYTPLAVFFYIGGKLLHKISGAGLSGTPTLPVTIENTNGAITTAISFKTVGLYIARQGELKTSPTSKYLQAEATTVLKYGAGVLKGIVIGAATNTADIRLYDGLSTAGILIWSTGAMDTRTAFTSLEFFGVPFSEGLTVDVFDAAANVLVVYE